MRRYWIDETQDDSNPIEFTISGESFHHIFDVCREEVGSQFEILNGSPESKIVEVINRSKKTALVKVTGFKKIAELPNPKINLFISMPKIPTFESVLEKAVELGVTMIQPFVSEYSFLKSKDSISEERTLRWRKIVRSACEQSYRSVPLVINPLCKLEHSFEIRDPKNFSIFAYEGLGTSLNDQLSGIKLTEFQEIDIFVGSEGGFSKTEVELFKKMDLNPISLGSQILRVETACISLVSILKYSSGHFK